MEEVTVDPVSGISTAEAADAAIGTFRRQQHRRPSNLLQCMDEDGNIDAFRYIEYSRQRRIEFLKRADFICKMKSKIRMQQQQQLNRSSSLPVMTALPVVSSSPSTANEIFRDTRSESLSPDFLNTPKSLGAGRPNNFDTDAGTIVPDAPSSARFMNRSSSMPFVSSFPTSTNTNNNLRKATRMTQPATNLSLGTSANSRNSEFETRISVSRPPQRRRLRKEEFEAAEALLFGMGRDSTNTSLPCGTNKSGKQSGGSSSEEACDDVTDAEAGNEGHGCIGNHRDNKTTDGRVSSKKRKTSDLPPGEIFTRTDEMGSVLSVVSTEEEVGSSSNNNDNTIIQEENIVL